MHETADDLQRLQRLLDRSYAAAGRHLLEVMTPERRPRAEEIVERLTDVCLLALATTTADGRPLVGPVDGIFFRGAFHFGSSPDAVRFRHIRRCPFVSATHLPGEEFAVTVHGQASLLDLRSPEQAAFRGTLLEVYVPRYGTDWETFLDAQTLYARIDATKMFGFVNSRAGPSVSA